MKRTRHRKLSIFAAITFVLLLVVTIGGLLFATRTGNTPFPSLIKKPSSTNTTAPPTGIPKPLFEDHFADNSKGWSIANVAGYTRILHSNSLLLADTRHSILVESIPTSTTFDDFSITTTFTLLQADANDSVGLYVRGDSNLDHDYRIDVFGNARYAISKETLNVNNDIDQTYLVHPAYCTILRPVGQRNTLSIAMKGSIMVVQVNGKTVHRLTDTGYTRGQIALFVSNGATSKGVKATFHTVIIYPIARNENRSAYVS